MPMTQPYQNSNQGSSEKSPSSHCKQVVHHVLKNVLKISKDERVSFSKWMDYMDYGMSMTYVMTFSLNSDISMTSVTTLWMDNILPSNLPLTMNKKKLFISWMLTRMKNKANQVSSECFLALTHEDFNDIRQAHMIRMTEAPTAPIPAPSIPSAPLTSQTSGSKKEQDFLPQHYDLFYEPVCESAGEIPLHLDELNSSPCSSFQSHSNPPYLAKTYQDSYS